ncbi:MAG: tetratricopeptide repeat protein [Candidatus Aminicenantes bacterium]|nr:MAG: tetratricopeptide repeat protein [Candidatus Aminicenantes bacterium]
MTTSKNTRIDKWWQEYTGNPLDALDRLLCRRVYMGILNRNETAEILFHLFHSKSNKTIRQLDDIMEQWFASHWGKIPGSISTSRWISILQNAFIPVFRLNLYKTALFLRDIYTRDKSWLRSLYLAPSRDPEGWLLRTLALCQKNQILLPLWMRLCRWEEDLPIHYTSIALLGLRKLPEVDGSPPGDLPPAVFKGIIVLAEALGKRKSQQCKEHWLMEVRAITALYPRSKHYWALHFLPFISHQPESIPAQWLNKAIPKLDAYFKPKSAVYIQPPTSERLEHFIKLLKKSPLEKFRGDLEIFLNEHRRYAYQTGDSYFLVRTFSNIGYRIFRQDTPFALALVKEAFTWAPSNPFLWSQRAIIEAFLGNYSNAAAILWEAKRRFPENPQIRSKLAHLMEKQGKTKTAEILYRQAIEDFPRDVVCLTGLAVVLLKKKQENKAISILEKIVKEFPRDELAKGLLETLKNGKEISEEDEKALELEAAKTVDKEILMEPDQEDDLDFPLSDQTVEISHVPGEKDEKLIEKTAAKSKASVIQAKKPEEYGIEISPGFIKAEINEVETKIGEIIIEHRESQGLNDEEKEQQKQRISSAVEEVLEKTPGNIPALLVKGLWLTDYEPGKAGDFFLKQTKSHPNTLGFRLLDLRTKHLKTKESDDSPWKELSGYFPGRSTIIKLDHALCALGNLKDTNGNALKELEKLRKQLSKDTQRLPVSLQKNEEWVKQTIRDSIFAGIDLKDTLSSKSLETINENLKEKEIRLRDTVNQCILSAL